MCFGFLAAHAITVGSADCMYVHVVRCCHSPSSISDGNPRRLDPQPGLDRNVGCSLVARLEADRTSSLLESVANDALELPVDSRRFEGLVGEDAEEREAKRGNEEQDEGRGPGGTPRLRIEHLHYAAPLGLGEHPTIKCATGSVRLSWHPIYANMLYPDHPGMASDA